MDSFLAMILDPFNYHEWKAKVGILLHSKGLYRVSLALENDPNAIVEKAKWHNRFGEEYGLLCLSISLDILFHLDGLTTPNQVWTKLESLFRVQDEIRTHQLENEPNAIVEKAKWHNRMDEAYGLVCLSLSPDILFDIDCLTTPN